MSLAGLMAHRRDVGQLHQMVFKPLLFNLCLNECNSINVAIDAVSPVDVLPRHGAQSPLHLYYSHGNFS